MTADRALLQRLETLTGTDGACCTDDLQAAADRVRALPAFQRRLAVLKALGDEKRLVAASLLKRSGEQCACELQAALGLTHATVSHHMGILAAAGVVKAERRGKWMHYALSPDVLEWIP